jgi:branched-chain amino acid transport system substrate-binding protein
VAHETTSVTARRTHRPGRLAALAALGALLAGLACSEPIEDADAGTSGGSGSTSADSPFEISDAPSAVEAMAGEDTTLGELPGSPVEATGEPIRIGMINQDTGAVGAFPELTDAAEAAVSFVNTELGGIDGRPLELITCDTGFSPEGSTACAQRLVSQGVVAVTGGIDIWGTSISVLESNEVPYIGGIPVSDPEMRSPISFLFSGGSPGAFAAFAAFAVEDLGAEKIAIMYGDFGSIKLAAEHYGAGVAQSLGLAPEDITLVPFPVTEDDLVPHLTAAAAGEPDAIIAGAADAACVPLMKAADDMGIEADMFLVGACAAPQILDAVGDSANGQWFNVEGPVTREARGVTEQRLLNDNRLYAEALARHSDGLDPAGAGTISFRDIMNITVLMREIGADEVSSATLISTLRASVDHPSFAGHPYTCDGTPIPELPSLCAPQQIIAHYDGESFSQASETWIDVPALVAGMD